VPTIRTITPTTTGAQTVFPLQGNQYEYLPFSARIEFGMTYDAGTDVAEMISARATVYSGSDILQQQGPLTDKTQVTSGSKQPVYPEDFVLDDVAAAGERLSIQLDLPATTTGDGFVWTTVKITPL